MNEKRYEHAIFKSIDSLICFDRSKENRYVSDGVYIVRRAPKRFLGQLSSLIHRSNALGSSQGGKSQNVVVLLFAASTHSLLSPASSHTERKRKERAQSPGPTCRSANVKRGVEPELANRTNTCPVQRERAAQTNVSCYTESPAGHRGPNGERITHFSIGDRCTNDNSKRHTSAAYLPFRWHQRDPAKVRNFVSRLLHSAAVS
ncbi:hypothetical protein RJ641_011887 [Dillenia turbinata]|uniref:Uncharacterized protein n=1 Tax=Dillenia turbinata TaxID=194707 RepID=A0AAN8Z7P9_9MAGN